MSAIVFTHRSYIKQVDYKISRMAIVVDSNKLP